MPYGCLGHMTSSINIDFNKAVCHFKPDRLCTLIFHRVEDCDTDVAEVVMSVEVLVVPEVYLYDTVVPTTELT